MSWWSRVATTIAPLNAGDTVSLGTGILRNQGIASLIDANGKFAPVEILNTNLPANTGFFNTAGATYITGNSTPITPAGVPARYLFNKTGGSELSAMSRIYFWDVTRGDIGGYIDSGISGGGFHMRICSDLGLVNVNGWLDLYAYSGITLGSPGGIILNNNMNPASNITVDGLDISEYITAWQLGLSLISNLAAGYTDCVAGDLGKVVTDDAAAIGTLYAYNNTTRVWTVKLYLPHETAAGSVMAITAGTGAGTTIAAASTESATRRQNVKKCYHRITLDGAGGATVNLTTDGKAAGTAIYTQEPTIIRSQRGATVPTVAISADFKIITLAAGGAADVVDIQTIGEVA